MRRLLTTMLLAASLAVFAQNPGEGGQGAEEAGPPVVDPCEQEAGSGQPDGPGERPDGDCDAPEQQPEAAKPPASAKDEEGKEDEDEAGDDESDPDEEDFTPTEEISEDYPVPLPSDI